MGSGNGGAAILVGALVVGALYMERGELPGLDDFHLPDLFPSVAEASTGDGGDCEAHVEGFDAEQVENAAIIAEVGVDMDMGHRGVVVALATAMQESGLRNLDYGDRDSLGLFQQRPSQGWGTPRHVQDPEYAARKFYEKLRTVRGWERMRVTEAAQRVQISAFPEAYQKHADEAERLAEAVEGC